MRIQESQLSQLAKALEAERKRQKLSREEAASVCGVSASFIRDVEANPESCSLGKLVKLISGLGLSLNVAGLLQVEEPDQVRSQMTHPNQRPDFGVPDDQMVNPKSLQQAPGSGMASLGQGGGQS